MCGILGGNKKSWNYQEALKTLQFRGPDGQRIVYDDEFTLGFSRLAIIDLSNNAMQPMSSEDGNYYIVFNGEIYDYLNIRRVLESKGYHFRTQSDTEVLLYSFIEWQDKMMDYIDGIFAFAILDKKNKKIHLFRDRAGIKPLYYYDDGKNFAFASELKAIEKMCCDCKFVIDNTAIYDYYTYLYIPEPKTLYKNVYKLKAATHLVYDLAARKIVTKKRYWKIKVNTKNGSILTNKQLEEKSEELREHLDNVIKKQIISDVPVGTFLSGGVDSSIVTLMTRMNMNAVTAYSIGFTDKNLDESIYAKRMAEKINVNIKSKTFTRNDFNRIYHLLPQLYDEPFADTSAFPTYFVSQFAKKDITVVLTGDGGDELFGGYPRCITAKEVLDKRKLCKKRISEAYIRIEKYLENINVDLGFICKEDLAYLAPMYQFSIRPDRNLLRKKYGIDKEYDDFWYYRQYYHKDLPPYTRMRYLDFMTYLNGDILTKVDRATMANSLEARVPFLDKEMIEFAFSLTQEECNPRGELKGLLKTAFEKEIPKKMFDRRKQGFSMPYGYVGGGNTCPQDQLLNDFWKMKTK